MLKIIKKIKFINLLALITIIIIGIGFVRNYTKLETQVEYNKNEVFHLSQEIERQDNILNQLIFEIQKQKRVYSNGRLY